MIFSYNLYLLNDDFLFQLCIVVMCLIDVKNPKTQNNASSAIFVMIIVSTAVVNSIESTILNAIYVLCEAHLQ
jgi:hypothetical protein